MSESMQNQMVDPAYQSPLAGAESDARSASNSWRWTAFLLAPIIWTAPAAILALFVALFTGLVFIPFGWVLAPFATLILLKLVCDALAKVRKRNGRVILSYLETAVRLNLPLPAFLIAAENSETGRRRRQLRRLREYLEAGWPIAAALQVVVDLSDDDVQTIAAHESIGQLGVWLTRSAERQRQEAIDKEDRPDDGIYRFYPAFLLIVVAAVMMFLMIFIIPKFREIFKDFRTPLPWFTEMVLRVSSTITEEPLLLIPSMALMVLLLVMPISVFMQRIFLPSWPEPSWAKLWGWVKWRLPLFRGMERDAAMASSCDLLAEALNAGVPFPVAVKQAANLPMNPGFQKRLADFRTRLTNGEPSATAAASAGMPAIFVGMLSPLSAEGVSISGSSMFAFLSRYYRQKFSRAVVLLQAAAGPIAVLVMGSLVLSVLLAIITALAALLQGVMAEPRSLL